MSELDPKRIAREWNREIDREIRLAQAQAGGKWQIVVWAVLAALWFVAVLLGMNLIRSLQW